MITITIIYDNESTQQALRPDWGFSCLINAYGSRILFDTGTDGALLLENMKALDIDPASIDELFLSHAHFDHIGGMSAFLGENGRVKVYAPSALRGIRPAKEVVYVDQAMEMHTHFHSTGLLEGVEQSMVIEDNDGVVVIVGCSHPGVSQILDKAEDFGKPHTLIGGLHGFSEFERLEPLRHVCPTHCTHHIAEIKSRYPEKYIKGGAGVVIKI